MGFGISLSDLAGATPSFYEIIEDEAYLKLDAGWFTAASPTWGSTFWNNPVEVVTTPTTPMWMDTAFGGVFALWNATGMPATYQMGEWTHDWFNGSSADEVVEGRGGNDVIFGGDGNDWLSGGNGNDAVDGGSGHDLVFGMAGDDDIYGGAGNDRVYGGTGNDVITGGAGLDYYNGGDGTDTYTASSGADWNGIGETINLATGNITDLAGDHDRIRHVENVQGGQGQDSITGSAQANVLAGGYGDDVIHGGDGNDIIYGDFERTFSHEDQDVVFGGNGDDFVSGQRMNGGAGADTFHFKDQFFRVVEDFVSGEDQLDLSFFTSYSTSLSTALPHLVNPNINDLISEGVETSEGLLLKVYWVDWFGDTREANILLEGIGKVDIAATDFIL